MKNYLKTILFTGFFAGSTAFTFTACRCPCTDFGLDIEFIGFDSTEVDTLIIRQYAKGSGFNRQIDTALFISEQHFRIAQSSDTLRFISRSGNLELMPHNDYIVLLPSVNQQFRVMDIETEQEYQSCIGVKVGCGNPVYGAKVNGVAQNPSKQYFRIYLKK